MPSNELMPGRVPTADNGPVTTGLDFKGPDLSPAPVPELSAFQPDPWAFLEYVDPISDPQMLAFQVAQLTVGMGELLRELTTLRNAYNLFSLEDFPEPLRSEIQAQIKARNDALPGSTDDVGRTDLGG